MKLDWKKTTFMKSAVLPKEYPNAGPHRKLVAICGRSNVGKSTLINEICAISNLAKTSSTPGKTQLLNFFMVDERMVLVDLPGYGYAKVPASMKKEWGSIITQFLENAKQLEFILFLLDIRRVPNEEDRQLLEWLYYHNKPFIVVLTKADKMTKDAQEKALKQIKEALGYDGIEFLIHSSKSHQGTLELRSKVEEYGTA